MAHHPTAGFVLWLTGLPASGKSTLARALHAVLAEEGITTCILDSDDLRAILTPAPAYSSQERDWFYSAVTALAAQLAHSGVNVIIAATGHRQGYRDQARAQIERFAEVYLECALETCAQRDPKGIYARARAGQAATVPGVGIPYEPPRAPEATVDMEQLSPDTAARQVVAQLRPFLVTAIDPAKELTAWTRVWPSIRQRLEEMINRLTQRDRHFYPYHAERAIQEFDSVLSGITKVANRLAEHQLQAYDERTDR